MKIIITCLILFLSSFIFRSDFLTEQKKHERVRTAIRDKESRVVQNLQINNLAPRNLHILIVVYKDSDELEIYGKNKEGNLYAKLGSYEICSRSGRLGPKRKYGDGQVPEGFYYIDRFNPTSSYYMSLGLSYPNKSDKKKSTASNLGGDIFIHGSCVTIGCMPMTDDKIKEIYLYAIYAKNNGQSKIPVYIFPFKMTDENFLAYKTTYQTNKTVIDFWSNLKTGYDNFIRDKKEIPVKVDSNGDYVY